MASRAAAYEQSGESQAVTLESLSKKLSDDLRSHIKTLGSFPLMGREWLAMVDSLQHISSIAVMEQKLPKQAGGDAMTLWDKDDMAVRMVLEEGKLNMCLRVLQDYKTMTRAPGAFESAASAASGPLGLPEAEIAKNMLAFEESLGLILHCCLKSVEAVQTLDMPVLCRHAGEVLGTVAATATPSRPNLTAAQESLVVQYLSSVGAFGENVDEDRIAELIEENKLVSLLLCIVHRDKDSYDNNFLCNAATFLGFVCDTEYFQTHKDNFLSDPTIKANFVGVGDLFLNELISKGALKKKQVRPLLDMIMKVKRTL